MCPSPNVTMLSLPATMLKGSKADQASRPDYSVFATGASLSSRLASLLCRLRGLFLTRATWGGRIVARSVTILVVTCLFWNVSGWRAHCLLLLSLAPTQFLSLRPLR